MNTLIIGFGFEELAKKADGLRVAVGFHVSLGQLQVEWPGLAHHALLDIEFGKTFEGTRLFRRELPDFFVDGDGFGEEAVLGVKLGEALEVFEGFECFALTHVEIADGHQGDLIARLVAQDLLIFLDGLGNLALIQVFLRGIERLGFVEAHQRCSVFPERWPSRAGCSRLNGAPASAGLPGHPQEAATRRQLGRNSSGGLR
jgi:hypothetical protein